MLFLAAAALVSEFSTAARGNWPEQFSPPLLLTFLAVKSLFEMANNVNAAGSQNVPETRPHHHSKVQICQTAHQPKVTFWVRYGTQRISSSSMISFFRLPIKWAHVCLGPAKWGELRRDPWNLWDLGIWAFPEDNSSKCIIGKNSFWKWRRDLRV